MGVVTPYTPQVWVDNVTPDNAAHMNPIEQGLANAVQKPTGLLDGEVPVWDNVNGGWERSSVKHPQWTNADIAAAAGIAVSKMAGYPNDATKALRGDGQWTAVPTARARNTVAQSVPNNAFTNVTGFNTTDWNQGCTVQTDRIIVPTAGVYLVRAHVSWASNVTGFRETYILVDGGIAAYNQQVATAFQAGAVHLPAVGLVLCNANSYIQIQVYQNSGGALNADVGSQGYMGLSVAKVS